MGLSGISCKLWNNEEEKNTELDIPFTDPDKISIQYFEQLIPPKIFNKMMKENIIRKNNKNNNKLKTMKMSDNLFENENPENKREIYYRGEFNELDQKDGIGKMIIINKNQEKFIYYGIWENDEIIEGRIYYMDESEYNGQIKNYLRHGKGEYVSELEKYEGIWKEDKKDGFGKIKFKDGMKYEGEFKNNKFNGKGDLYLPNGAYYSGNFVNNLFNGEGFFQQKNNIYNGHFKNGLFNGYGEFKWIDGIDKTIYKGNYSNGKKDGKGTLILKNGDIFKGNWESGYPHGEGVYETKNRKYFANWRTGIFTQLVDVEEKEGAEEENICLNFQTPNENVDIANIATSLNSNLSCISTLIDASVEIFH